jgi:restriction system protein
MKRLKMHEGSLFAILLRSPWWASALAALATAAAARFFVPAVYAAFSALPFLVIAAIVAWRQLRAPSARRVAQAIERLRAMPADEAAAAMEEGFRRQGYAVKRLAGERADFALERSGRTALVACRRWKATRTGLEPLRELDEMRRAQDAHECMYVAAGEVTEQARRFAMQKGIRLLEGVELAKLVFR